MQTKKVKVMHLLQSNHFSGAENVVINIMKAFQNDEEIEMIYVSRKGPIEEILERENLKYHMLEKFNKKNINAAVKYIKPNIIHAHDFNASTRSAQYKYIKILSHLHHNPVWLSQFNVKTIIFALALLRIEKVIGVSSSIKEEYIFRRWLEKKFIVLPNCINYRRILDKLKFPNTIKESIDILFVGRLSIPKNPLLFLEIIKQLVELNPILKVGMVGDGELRGECETYIAINNLEKNVILFGFQENPYVYMNKTKFLIMPSKWEGFGLVAVEAMLLRKPVLCSGVGGLKEIVNNECGMICKSINDYIEGALELLENPVLLEEKGNKAYKRAMQYTDVGTYCAQITSIYKDMVIRE